jgi:hypothetical protein
MMCLYKNTADRLDVGGGHPGRVRRTVALSKSYAISSAEHSNCENSH